MHHLHPIHQQQEMLRRHRQRRRFVPEFDFCHEILLPVPRDFVPLHHFDLLDAGSNIGRHLPEREQVPIHIQALRRIGQRQAPDLQLDLLGVQPDFPETHILHRRNRRDNPRAPHDHIRVFRFMAGWIARSTIGIKHLERLQEMLHEQLLFCGESFTGGHGHLP